MLLGLLSERILGSPLPILGSGAVPGRVFPRPFGNTFGGFSFSFPATGFSSFGASCFFAGSLEALLGSLVGFCFSTLTGFCAGCGGSVAFLGFLNGWLRSYNTEIKVIAAQKKIDATVTEGEAEIAISHCKKKLE